jgi:hypothetical protein
MTLAQGPLICVILPAYNVGHYIQAAIASLKAQTFPDFEALVIDDGSTDDTAEKARAAIGDDPRFRMIRQANKGLSGARNTGLDAATTPYISFLDGDDRYDPQFLEVLLQDLMASGGDWIACGVTFCSNDGGKHPHSAIHGSPVASDSLQAKDIAMTHWAEVICHFPSAWNKLYRRDFIRDLRFDEGTWYEDHTFFQRLAAQTETMRYVPRPLYLYTLERDGQITRADSERVFEQFAVLETSAKILRSSSKSGAETGLARLATRLFNERLDAIQSTERSARFLAKATAFFANHNLQPDWRWDSSLDVLRSFALSGTPPITIRMATADPVPHGDLLPPPTSRLAHKFGYAAPSTPVPEVGLVLDLPGPIQLDHEVIAQAGEALLRSDCAAIVAPRGSWPPAQGTNGSPPIAGLSAKGPAQIDPGQVVALGMTDHLILVKAAHTIPVERNPDFQTVRQADRLGQAGLPVLWSPKPFAAVAPAVSYTEILRRIDGFAVDLGAVPRPEGWDRRLFLRQVGRNIIELQQDTNPFRRRSRLVFPLLRLWLIGQRRGWVGAPGTVDAQMPRVLRRIFRLPPIA